MSAGPAALDPARYAIAGVEPLSVRRPAAREEAADVLRSAARDGLAVVPWGGGVSLARGRAPGRYDLALDLTALDRVVEHRPEDMTLTAECGVTLGTLRAALAARGQELPLEGARPDRATLGGLLAANASGPRRLRCGAPRDCILGAHFALADGTLARSGGRVVKNVAGYAIHRLLCGSQGGLAVLLEASLKLAPAPARRVALVFGVGHRALGDPVRWAALPRLEPAVLTTVGQALAGALPVASPTDPFTVIVGFEDDEARVAQQAAVVERLLGEPDARLEDDSAATLWGSLTDLEDRDGARLTFTGAANTPAALAPLIERPEAAAGALFHAAAGRLHVFPGCTRAREIVDSLARAGFALLETVAGDGDPAGVAALQPLIAPQTAVLELRARIHTALDPAGVMAYGTRWEQGGP
jgi:glycolate oxidase FAD binding subunit